MSVVIVFESMVALLPGTSPVDSAVDQPLYLMNAEW